MALAKSTDDVPCVRIASYCAGARLAVAFRSISLGGVVGVSMVGCAALFTHECPRLPMVMRRRRIVRNETVVI